MDKIDFKKFKKLNRWYLKCANGELIIASCYFMLFIKGYTTTVDHQVQQLQFTTSRSGESPRITFTKQSMDIDLTQTAITSTTYGFYMTANDTTVRRYVKIKRDEKQRALLPNRNLIYKVLEDLLGALGASPNMNNNGPTQSPVMAVAAPAVLDQNNATACTCAANAFYHFQQQQFHQTPSMFGQQQSVLSRPCLQSTNSNIGQQSSNAFQQRTQIYRYSCWSSLSDQYNSNQTATYFSHTENLHLSPLIPLNGNNSTNSSNVNPCYGAVLQPIAAKNDDNLSYFPSINNSNNINLQQQTFLNYSNNTNNGLFNGILSNNNNNPISTLANNRQQQPYKPLSTMTYPQQQQIRNDENVFHNNHQYATNFDANYYPWINMSNNGGVPGGSSSNDSSFFYFGSANAHATAAYNFYHPNRH